MYSDHDDSMCPPVMNFENPLRKSDRIFQEAVDDDSLCPPVMNFENPLKGTDRTEPEEMSPFECLSSESMTFENPLRNGQPTPQLTNNGYRPGPDEATLQLQANIAEYMGVPYSY